MQNVNSPTPNIYGQNLFFCAQGATVVIVTHGVGRHPRCCVFPLTVVWTNGPATRAVSVVVRLLYVQLRSSDSI